MIELIVAIALAVGVDAHLFQAIVETENSTLNPYAINVNSNGTVDRGLCQLNSSWYDDPLWYVPEVNLKAGAQHLKRAVNIAGGNMWMAAIIYNAGEKWFVEEAAPPMRSVEYADKVFKRYNELRGYKF